MLFLNFLVYTINHQIFTHSGIKVESTGMKESAPCENYTIVTNLVTFVQDRVEKLVFGMLFSF